MNDLSCPHMLKQARPANAAANMDVSSMDLLPLGIHVVDSEGQRAASGLKVPGPIALLH